MLRPRGRAVPLALLALAAGAISRADEPKQTRIVIRGTGNKVTIERTPGRPRRPAPGQPASPVIAEAARISAKGSGDDAVIAYLRRHQNELPEVLEASDVAFLRKAGAGPAVVHYLQAVAAVDLGALGEGREGSEAPAAPESQAASLEANGYPAYPFYGAYGYGGGSYFPMRGAFRGGTRFPHRPFFRKPMRPNVSPHHPVAFGHRRPW